MKVRSMMLLLMLTAAGTASGQALRVMTYNIRYDNPGDGPNEWKNRKDLLSGQIRTVSPDVLGIQEGLSGQVGDLDRALPGYRHTGAGRDDGKEQGEFSAIFYRLDRVKLLKHATFWLSPTPEKVSKGWDAACVRICTWGLFRDRASGRKFWVLNTHFDHMGTEARINSARLILEKIVQMNRRGWPVVLTGDFNTGPDSEPVKMILATFADAKVADKSMQMGPDGTFNGFDPEHPVTERIDFIFLQGFEPADYTVIRREGAAGKFASDHFPVVAGINWAN